MSALYINVAFAMLVWLYINRQQATGKEQSMPWYARLYWYLRLCLDTKQVIAEDPELVALVRRQPNNDAG
jgi:hypothetical protein